MKILKKQRTKKMSNLTKQVGGTHYQKEIQPWDIIAEYKMNWFQGEILKYVTRFKYKGGKQDLEKAVTVAVKAHINNIKGSAKNTFTDIPFILQYVKEYTKDEPGDLLPYLWKIVTWLLNGNYGSVKVIIESLMDEIYGKEETSTAD